MIGLDRARQSPGDEDEQSLFCRSEKTAVLAHMSHETPPGFSRPIT
jgi:hypothetical protein